MRTSIRHTWLNLRVNATTLGAKLCFSFPFHPQLASSCKSENQTNSTTSAMISDNTALLDLSQ